MESMRNKNNDSEDEVKKKPKVEKSAGKEVSGRENPEGWSEGGEGRQQGKRREGEGGNRDLR